MPKSSKSKSSKKTVGDEKLMGVLAYFVFFIPMIAAKDSKFAMFHANQGLLLLLFAIGVNIIGTLLPIIGWFLVLPLGNIAILVLFVIGVLNAANGELKELPVIGSYRLLN